MDNIFQLVADSPGSYWKIESNGRKVFEYGSEDKAESDERFKTVYASLPDGKYTVMIREGKNGHAGQNHFDFSKRELQNLSSSKPMTPQISEAERLKIFEEGKQAGYQQAKTESRLDALEKQYGELLAEIKKLYDILNDLNDEDEDNDDDALTKISKGAETFKGLTEAFKSLKSA